MYYKTEIKKINQNEELFFDFKIILLSLTSLYKANHKPQIILSTMDRKMGRKNDICSMEVSEWWYKMTINKVI